MVHQPVATVDDSDIDRLVSRDFPDDGDRARLALSQLSGAGAPRVRAAALKCADGSIEHLERVVAHGLGDWRDLLLAGEYPRYGHLSEDERRDPDSKAAAIEGDAVEYDEWFRRR